MEDVPAADALCFENLVTDHEDILRTLAALCPANEASDAPPAEDALALGAEEVQAVSDTGLFNIYVDRSDGSKLGVDVESSRLSPDWDGRTLLVKGVQPAGLIAGWNEGAHDASRVQSGDRIIQVNGISGDALAMIAACKAETNLHMVLSRPEPQSSAASRHCGPAAESAPTLAGHKRWRDIAPQWRVEELQESIRAAPSASSTVQLLRTPVRNSGEWHSKWAAEGLYNIARKSTLRTRPQWVEDPTVLALSQQLLQAIRDADADNTATLLALEALQRLELESARDHLAVIERVASDLAADSWKQCSTRELVQIMWLAAPLQSRASQFLAEALRKHLPMRLCSEAGQLDAVGAAMVLDALLKVPNERLLQKMLLRLGVTGVCSTAIPSDLVQIADSLAELGVSSSHGERHLAALQALGQEVMVRRAEHSPDELQRIQKAFEVCGLPLRQAWKATGATTKKRGGQVVTTQVFSTQARHGKKARKDLQSRTAHELESTSPPREVADRVNTSY
mmetsp:Transcript_58111/g.138253  ORF Transcript_58111/g.138253 Transcript_58111/m.138253 type:complete len:510 (-) Transcript_58111:18-1547(-)